MGTNSVSVNIHDSIEEAPNYEEPEFKSAVIESVEVIANGTVGGNPTIDVIFVAGGQKYVAMIAADLMTMVHGVIQGVKARNQRG